MLYTMTTNPAVDVNVTTDYVSTGVVNRTRDMVFTANGKGLNVSFALQRFGVPSGIIGFFGGFTGDYITSYCKEQGYPLVEASIEGTTRINFFICAEQGEFKFVNKGPLVSTEAQDHLLQQMEQLTDLDLLTIHGSAANGQAEDFYDRVFELCNKKGVPVALDISSPKLKELLKHRPLLIKPNDEELMEIFGLPTENEQQILAALRALHEMGAQNILLTMGGKGSYFYDGTNTYKCGTKKVKLKSSACAGDAYLGGFLSIWAQDKNNIEKALKRAAASGANAAESDALGDLMMVDEYEKSIAVCRLEAEV